LPIEEVHDLVKPSEDTLDLVHEWLLLNGVNQLDYSPAKDWISIYIDIGSAERLLDTEYSVFLHEDGSQLVRTSQWSLPLHLHELVDTIQPTTSFMRSKGQSTDYIQFADNKWTPPGYKPPTNETIAKVCNIASVTLECFNTLYGTLGYHQKVPGINKIGFNNYLNQTPIRPDISQFLKEYNTPAAHTAFTFKSIEIAKGPAARYTPLTPEEASGTDFFREANLDAQTILGMTYPQPVYSYSTGGSPPFTPDINTPKDTNEPYLVWVNYVSAQKDVPQVISSSYGDDEQTVPKSYAQRVCQQFAQLGARGISLLVSSGDGALGGEDDSACFTNDGKNTSTFLPGFPASCPYVTAVGATMEFEPEVPAFREPGLGPDGNTHGYYASGSGFSYYFSRPRYQDGVVDKYVKNLPKGLYKGLYNPSKHLAT
jgi:tripeptidyl-peptidase-1